MEIGIFAKTFAGESPDSVFAQCRAAGFSTVQYNMACSGLGSLPTTIPDETVQQIKDAVRAHGVTVAAISATYNMTDPDTARRGAGREAFAEIARCAADLGVSLLTVCSGSLDAQNQWNAHPDNGRPESWEEMCREFDLLLAVAQRHGIVIGVEPEPANIVSCAPNAARLLERFSNERIRIVFDPANILEHVPPAHHRETLDQALDLLGPSIALAHAKDRLADGSVAPAGRGVVDWDRVLDGLSSAGFSGPLIAHGMRVDEAPAVADFLAGAIAERLAKP